MKKVKIILLLFLMLITLTSCIKMPIFDLPAPNPPVSKQIAFRVWQSKGHVLFANSTYSCELGFETSIGTNEMKMEYYPRGKTGAKTGTPCLSFYNRTSQFSREVSSSSSLKQIFSVNKIPAATNILQYYDVSIDRIIFNIAATVTPNMEQVIIEFKKDGTSKMIYLLTPTVTPNSNQSAFDSTITGATRAEFTIVP